MKNKKVLFLTIVISLFYFGHVNAGCPDLVETDVYCSGKTVGQGCTVDNKIGKCAQRICNNNYLYCSAPPAGCCVMFVAGGGLSQQEFCVQVESKDACEDVFFTKTEYDRNSFFEGSLCKVKKNGGCEADIETTPTPTPDPPGGGAAAQITSGPRCGGFADTPQKNKKGTCKRADFPAEQCENFPCEAGSDPLTVDKWNLSDCLATGGTGDCYACCFPKAVTPPAPTPPGGGGVAPGVGGCPTGMTPQGKLCFPANTGLSEKSVKNIVEVVLGWLLGIFGSLGVLAFVISGILYLTGAGDADQEKKAKEGMKWGIIGVIVGLSGFVIIQAINTILTAQV